MHSALAEEGNHAAAVRDRGVGGVAVGRHADARIGIFRQRGLHVGLPELFTRREVDADEVPHQLVDVAGIFLGQAVAGVAGHEHAAIDDDRARGAGPGKGGLPGEVGFWRPFRGHVRHLCDHASARRPAETWPVVCRLRDGRTRHSYGEQSGQNSHSDLR